MKQIEENTAKQGNKPGKGMFSWKTKGTPKAFAITTLKFDSGFREIHTCFGNYITFANGHHIPLYRLVHSTYYNLAEFQKYKLYSNENATFVENI